MSFAKNASIADLNCLSFVAVIQKKEISDFSFQVSVSGLNTCKQFIYRFNIFIIYQNE